MKIGHVERFVADVERARRFYVDVLGGEDVTPAGQSVAWVRLGPLEVLLRPGPGGSAEAYADCGTALVLYTEDLPAARARLEAGGVAMRGEDGSPRCPTFCDPDGHWIQLVDPRSP